MGLNSDTTEAALSACFNQLQEARPLKIILHDLCSNKKASMTQKDRLHCADFLGERTISKHVWSKLQQWEGMHVLLRLETCCTSLLSYICCLQLVGSVSAWQVAN